ncbi:MAG: PVC-type heme-binding CxxCH protein, partial [Vicinamibacterales bacterium]
MRILTTRGPLLAAVGLVGLSFVSVQAVQQGRAAWPPAGARKTPEKAPTLSAEEELKTFVLPPGYRAELVAKEPLVVDPIAMDFDADGRMWVLEMQGFMSEPNGANSREPINDIVVLEDTDHDGVMDKRTVFADKLVLPRALKVLDQGVLVGEPPNLWLMKDTDGDFKADTKDLVSDTYGRPAASIEHNANSLFWAMDNVMYTSEGDFHLRLKNGKVEMIPTLARGQWGATQDDAGRVFRNVNDAPLFAD